jgi:hypothetical protein
LALSGGGAKMLKSSAVSGRAGRMAIAPVLKTGAAKAAYRFESCALRALRGIERRIAGKPANQGDTSFGATGR